MRHPAFERALEIVRRDLYEHDGLEIGGDKIPFACRMHETFGSLDGVCHNCLGCNFADATNGIEHSLVKILAVEGSLELDCADYILWLYLFVERANIVFDAVSLPESYRARHFDCFVTIKRWANFFKHPNYFLMVHHADWFIEGDEGYDPSRYGCVIDSDFVRENYGAEAKSRKGAIKTRLQNKNDVAVLFPDLVSLTDDFCIAAHGLFTLAEKNEAFGVSVHKTTSVTLTAVKKLVTIAAQISGTPLSDQLPIDTIMHTDPYFPGTSNTGFELGHGLQTNRPHGLHFLV